MWQDTLFSAGSLVLWLTLIPTLKNADSVVPRTTSIPTAAVLFMFIIGYITMGFNWSATVGTGTFLTWVGIAVWRAP